MIRDERGLSMVEMILVLLMGTLLVVATLDVFDSFSDGTAEANKLVQAQDDSRAANRIVQRELRNAVSATGGSAIESVSARAIVFRTPDWPGLPTTGAIHAVRLCVSAGGELWRNGILNPPTTLPDAGTACPSAVAAWGDEARKLATGLEQGTGTVFSADAAGRAVSVDIGGKGPTITTRHRSATFVRSRREAAPAVTNDDVTCTRRGSEMLIDLGVDNDSNGDPLSVVFFDSVTGLQLGEDEIALGAGTRNIRAEVTNVLGLKTVLTKAVSC